MKTIKELEAEILSTAWADEIFTKKGAVDALKDVLGLIDELQQEFSNIKINPHKAYAKPHEIYDLCIKKIEELNARITG